MVSSLNPHVSGVKLDAGKPRVSLVLGDFSKALWAVSQIGTFGANKYTDSGWLDVPDGISRYADAQLRHCLLAEQGELFDSESEMLHVAHEAWNCLAKLELILQTQGNEQ
jgi:hypothetical protein